jgi:hypothetical protein
MHWFNSEKGDYSFTLTVSKPAAGMKGREQELVAKYWLSGHEILPALLAGLFSIVFGLIGVIVLLLVWWCVRKRRRRDAEVAGM